MDLWQQMHRVAEQAKRSGHLVSISNTTDVLKDGDIDFVIRYAPQLIDKIRASKGEKRDNPFLPPEPELQVCALGEQHQLILNKFNVLETHGLMVTNKFVAQTDQLQLADFKAVARVLQQTDGLVFYNGGEEAGASQAHRHFQIVPQDFGLGALPIQAAIDLCSHHEHATIFPFEHRLFWLPNYQAETLMDAWLKLEYAWQPYNLLMTQQWMLVVPRKCESYQGISVNSLGFAGGLLAKTAQEHAMIRDVGAMNFLSKVCFPK